MKYVDATMEQSKQNDSEDWGKGRSIRVVEDIRGEVTRDGRVSRYAYHLVYAQESVRVLDMRLVSPSPGLPGHLFRVLRRRLLDEGYGPDQIRWEGLPGLAPAMMWSIVEDL